MVEVIIVDVKENIGSKMLKVRIISRSKIDDSTIRLIKNMTLDEVRKYGQIKGWVVGVVEH